MLPEVWVGTSFSLRHLRTGLSFSFLEMLAFLPGTLSILRVATPELVGRARGRPLGPRRVATGLAPGAGGITNVGQIPDFLVLGERKTLGLPRGPPFPNALDPGGVRAWMPLLLRA